MGVHMMTETRLVQPGNSDSNDFPQLPDAGIILNDDAELDRIAICQLASYCVEVCNDIAM